MGIIAEREERRAPVLGDRRLRGISHADSRGKALSARWLARKNGKLSIERPLVSGPRFGASDIAAEIRIAIQQAGTFQPLQHMHHHQVAGAERTIEPVSITEAIGQLLQPVANATLD